MSATAAGAAGWPVRDVKSEFSESDLAVINGALDALASATIAQDRDRFLLLIQALGQVAKTAVEVWARLNPGSGDGTAPPA